MRTNLNVKTVVGGDFVRTFLFCTRTSLGLTIIVCVYGSQAFVIFQSV